MSSHKRHFVPFGDFRPDDPEFASQALKKAKNVLPMFGALRPLREIVAVGADDSSAGLTSDDPIIGGMVHLTSVATGLEYMRPSSDVSDGVWYKDDGRSQDDMYDEVNELEVDHNDKVSSRDTGAAFEVLLTTPDNAPDVVDGHILKIGYMVYNCTGNWTLRITVTNDLAGTFTFDITGTTPMVAPSVYEHSLSAGDVAVLQGGAVAYAGVKLKAEIVTMTVDDEVADFYPYSDIAASGWKNEDDDEVGLYASIDEWPMGNDPPSGTDADNWDDTDYIACPDLEPGEKSEYGVYINSAQPSLSEYLGAVQEPVFRYRVKADQSGIALVITIKQIVSGAETVAKTITLDPVPETITSYTEEFTEAEADLIDWGYPVIANFEFENTAAEGTEDPTDLDTLYPPQQTVNLKSCTSSHNLKTKAGASSNSAVVNAIKVAADETDYIDYYDFGSGAVEGYAFFDLTDYVQAADFKYARVYVHCSGDANSTLRLTLQDGSGYKKKKTIAAGSIGATATVQAAINLTGDLMPESGVQLRLDTYDKSVRIYSIYIRLDRDSDEATSPVPAGGVAVVKGAGYVYGAVLHSQALSTASLTWMRIEAPSPKDEIPGDVVKVYAGTKRRLYEVDPDTGVFTDKSWVSAPSTPKDYGVTNASDEPKLWRFSHWGDWILATNYVDPIQVLKPGESEFSNLLTDTEPPYTLQPYAKHLAVTGSQLMIADVNPNIWSDGKMFTAWVSAVGNPEVFYEGNANYQSTFFQLVRSMGQITGLVGGEWGLITKRNSIWRATYEGLPRVWRFDQVSLSIGCPHPRSLISDGNNVFFCGNRRFYIVVDGQQLNPISTAQVERFFFDPSESDSTIASADPLKDNENDSIVVGARDPYSNLIWWFYRDDDAIDFNMDRWACYNQVTGQWAHGEDAGANITFAMERPNVLGGDSSLTRGLYLFQNRTDKNKHYLSKFSGNYSYQGELQTKTISSADFAGVDQGEDITIFKVRPILKMQEDVLTGIRQVQELPRMEIIVRSSQDPQMLRDQQERTVTFGEMETDPVSSWVDIEPISGEFFDFELHFPTFKIVTENLRELYGLQILYKKTSDL